MGWFVVHDRLAAGDRIGSLLAGPVLRMATTG